MSGPGRLAPLSVLLPLLAALLCGCLRAETIRRDLREGRTQGAYVEDVPFQLQKPEECGPNALSSLLRHWGRQDTPGEIARQAGTDAKGTLGFSLWLYAHRAGLAAVQAKPLDESRLDALLSQGVPVILNLGLVREKGPQHYVLAVAHDRSRDAWVVQDGRSADRVVSRDWLMKRWEATGRWALIAFPPERPVKGLGADLHLKAAEGLEDLKQPEAMRYHLQAALTDAGDAPALWMRIARLQKILGQTEEAEKSFRRVMTLEPGNPAAPNNLALLLMENPTRLDEAEALARSSVTLCRRKELAPWLPCALDTLGQVFRRQNREADARNAFEAALKAAPPDGETAREIRTHLEGR